MERGCYCKKNGLYTTKDYKLQEESKNEKENSANSAGIINHRGSDRQLWRPSSGTSTRTSSGASTLTSTRSVSRSGASTRTISRSGTGTLSGTGTISGSGAARRGSLLAVSFISAGDKSLG